MNIIVTILYIVACVMLFSLAIAIHEFGHFVAALKLGLKVERFSIGFGPAIWKKVWRGVEYRISWIPLGGYVSIPEVDPEGTKKLEGETTRDATRRNIPAWKELVVAFAGPAMNLVLALAIAVVLSLVPQARFGQLGTEITEVFESGPAARGGMLPGDRVLSVAGHPVTTWAEMQTEVQLIEGSASEFVVDRGGERLALTVAPERDEVTGAWYIKALTTNDEVRIGRFMPARSPLRQIAWDAGSIFRVLKGLVTPKEMKATGKALGGPVMIAEGIYVTLRNDFWDGLGFMRFLNVNLAVVNLLPIPVLDGGLILFALIAMVFRRRVPEKVVTVLSTAFMYLLLALMGLLIFRDGIRSWRIHTYRPPAVETGDATEEKSDDGQKSDAHH